MLSKLEISAAFEVTEELVLLISNTWKSHTYMFDRNVQKLANYYKWLTQYLQASADSTQLYLQIKGLYSFHVPALWVMHLNFTVRN